MHQNHTFEPEQVAKLHSHKNTQLDRRLDKRHFNFWILIFAGDLNVSAEIYFAIKIQAFDPEPVVV